MKYIIYIFIAIFIIISALFSNSINSGFTDQKESAIVHEMPLDDCVSVFTGDNGEIWCVGLKTTGRHSTSVMASRFDGTQWGQLVGVSTGKTLEYRPVIAFDGKGKVWVVWCAKRNENWDVFARWYDSGNWSDEMRVTDSPKVDYKPSVTIDKRGNLWLAWESLRTGKSQIFISMYNGRTWTKKQQLSTNGEYNFRPAAACDESGRVWIVWDSFRDKNFDFFGKFLENGRWSEEIIITDTPIDEIKPQIEPDKEGNVWIAGTGRLGRNETLPGTLIGFNGHQMIETMVKSPLQKEETIDGIAVDNIGRLWVFTSIRALQDDGEYHWIGYRKFCYNGSQWSEPMDNGTGFDWMSPVFDDKGVMWRCIGNTPYAFDWRRDELTWLGTKVFQVLPDESITGGIRRLETRNISLIRDNTEIDVSPKGEKREIIVNGETLYPYFGDLHIHQTERPNDITIDIGTERVFLFADYRQGMDFAATTNHDYIEFTDARQAVHDVASAQFNEPGKFVAFPGFEWSIGQPLRELYGDLATVFIRETNTIYPMWDVSFNSPTKFFRILRRINGIAVPHHVGGPWAPNHWEFLDEYAQPVVQITSCHGVYECYDENNVLQRWKHGNVVPGTSVQDALAKGVKIGITAASDSHSGLSGLDAGMAGVLAKELTREGIFEALRKRRTWGIRGGEKIIVDFRISGYLMGDEFSTVEYPQIKANIFGTDIIKKIEIVRNNEYIHSERFNSSEAYLSYIDKDVPVGKNYYYIRITQRDEGDPSEKIKRNQGQYYTEMPDWRFYVEEHKGEAYAWSSPIWVNYIK